MPKSWSRRVIMMLNTTISPLSATMVLVGYPVFTMTHLIGSSRSTPPTHSFPSSAPSSRRGAREATTRFKSTQTFSFFRSTPCSTTIATYRTPQQTSNGKPASSSGSSKSYKIRIPKTSSFLFRTSMRRLKSKTQTGTKTTTKRLTTISSGSIGTS